MTPAEAQRLFLRDAIQDVYDRTEKPTERNAEARRYAGEARAALDRGESAVTIQHAGSLVAMGLAFQLCPQRGKPGKPGPIVAKIPEVQAWVRAELERVAREAHEARQA